MQQVLILNFWSNLSTNKHIMCKMLSDFYWHYWPSATNILSAKPLIGTLLLFGGINAIWMHTHSQSFRECLGPIIGGALVYKVGFQSMAAVSYSVVSCYVRNCLYCSSLIPRLCSPHGLWMRLVLQMKTCTLYYDRLISAILHLLQVYGLILLVCVSISIVVLSAVKWNSLGGLVH